VVESPWGTIIHALASVRAARATLPAPRGHRHPLYLSSCGKPLI
jgi:hypothetical protein